jgi:hypothetical protein
MAVWINGEVLTALPASLILKIVMPGLVPGIDCPPGEPVARESSLAMTA